PSIQTLPRSGRNSPTSVLRNTDLPVPEGPSSTEISPAGRVSETSCQMTCEPKLLVSPSTAISTPTPQVTRAGRAGYGQQNGPARAGRGRSVRRGTGPARECYLTVT